MSLALRCYSPTTNHRHSSFIGEQMSQETFFFQRRKQRFRQVVVMASNPGASDRFILEPIRTNRYGKFSWG